MTILTNRQKNIGIHSMGLCKFKKIWQGVKVAFQHRFRQLGFAKQVEPYNQNPLHQL